MSMNCEQAGVIAEQGKKSIMEVEVNKADETDLYSMINMQTKVTIKNSSYEDSLLTKEKKSAVTAMPVYATVNKRKKKSLKDSDNDSELEGTSYQDNVTETQLNASEKTQMKTIAAVFLVVISMVLFLISLILFIVLFVKVNNLEQTQSSGQETIHGKVTNISEELLNLHSDIQHQLDLLQNIPSSCADILQQFPNAPSGYYIIKSSNNSPLISVFCEMSLTCGNVTGGWTRVAQLDTHNCPPVLVHMNYSGIDTCIRNDTAFGCTSLIYNSFNHYSSVCGKVRAYIIGTPDGFHGMEFNVTDNYLDGISLTNLNTHIWSFAADSFRDPLPEYKCSQNKPDFVGNDLTYDGTNCNEGHLCGKLWDRNRCGLFTPHIHKQLKENTTADITVRVCRDEQRSNEDIAISALELYIR